MPWPSEHRSESRDRILRSAERLFTESGFDNVSIDQVMQNAGMTRGAFYSHFKSKRDLYSEAILSGAYRMAAQHPADVEQLIRRYLSVEHLRPEMGSCPLAFLVSDISQRDDQVRETYTRIFNGLAGKISGSKEPSPTDEVLRTLVLMVGGVAVSRAVSDPVLAERILSACCEGALDQCSSVSEQE